MLLSNRIFLWLGTPSDGIVDTRQANSSKSHYQESAWAKSSSNLSNSSIVGCTLHQNLFEDKYAGTQTQNLRSSSIVPTSLEPCVCLWIPSQQTGPVPGAAEHTEMGRQTQQKMLTQEATLVSSILGLVISQACSSATGDNALTLIVSAFGF